MDYIISDETCFVDFLTCYLEYAHDNWSAFTSSHHGQDIKRAAGCSTDQTGIVSLSRKRKRGHQTEHLVYTSIQVDDSNRSLVVYDLSDSSEESDPVDQSVFHKTMSCIIRLRLALERMLKKEIILSSQAPAAKIVSVIERLETLYERMD